MAGVEASQIVIVVAFLALLVGVQVWVRRNREGLGARLRPGREVEILETVALAPHERLTLVQIGTRWHQLDEPQVIRINGEQQ